MTVQTITLPARSAGFGGTSLWAGTAILIDPLLIDGGGTGYLQYFALTSSANRVDFRLDTSSTGSGTGSGPNLTAAVLAGTITLTYGTDSVVLDSTHLSEDTTEPYIWNHDDVDTFQTTVGSNAGLQIIIDDLLSGLDFSFLGDDEITAAYVGSTEIEKIYLGATEL